MTAAVGDFQPVGAVRTAVGESPVWLPETQELWWVDVHPGTLHRLRTETGEITSREIAHRFAFVVRADFVLGGYVDGLVAVDVDGSEDARVLRVDSGRAFTRPNDGACDPRGRLWFGTVDRKGERGRCHLYSLDEEGRLRTELEDVSISNGLGWSPDGRTMYYIDSATASVDAIDFDPETARLGARRTLATIPRGLPDGLTVDAEGCLWVAVYGGGCLLRIDPLGTVVQEVNLPTSNPTSCTFGGPELDQLFVTTSNAALLHQGASVSTYDGALLVAHTNTRGLEATPSRVPREVFSETPAPVSPA